MVKVLVTGGAGFIGSHIVERCLQVGYETVVIDNLSTGKREYVPSGATFYPMDIRSELLEDILDIERPDVVIHQAAQIDVQRSLKDPDFDAAINIIGTLKLLNACAAAGVRKVVYASSAAVYGHPAMLPITEGQIKAPISFYGVSKYVPEFYIKTFAGLHNLDYCILRYSNVYGMRQAVKGEGGVISLFVDRVLRGQPLHIYGDGEQTRDFVFVEDVAAANVAAVERGNQVTVNVSTGQSVSLNELVSVLETVTQQRHHIQYFPQRSGDIVHSCLSNDKARDLLNWRPETSLAEGLAKTLSYYIAQQDRQAARNSGSAIAVPLAAI